MSEPEDFSHDDEPPGPGRESLDAWAEKLSPDAREALRRARVSLIEREELFSRLVADWDLWNHKADKRTRRYTQWALGRRDLPGTVKVVLQAVALRMKAEGDPCTAGYHRLARDTGLSRSTVYTHLKDAEESGHLARSKVRGRLETKVTLVPSDADRTDLFRLWHTAQRPERPEELDHHLTAVRWEWERAVRDTLTDPTEKGTCWAVSLLVDGEGGPYRRTSREEITALSGFSASTVKRRLGQLEAEGWLYRKVMPGRGGGVVFWLTVPEHAHEEIQRRRILREELP